MAKQTKAKLDKKGLSGLGLEKLVDILLEEAAANKALKARLQTALAGETGPDEMARLIDKRLDAIDQATTRINKARARDMAVEFAALARNILSELGSVDPQAAGERILRFIGLRFSLSARLVADSARLWKVFDDTELAALELIKTVGAEEQPLLVPHLERLRRDALAHLVHLLAGHLGLGQGGLLIGPPPGAAPGQRHVHAQHLLLATTLA